VVAITADELKVGSSLVNIGKNVKNIRAKLSAYHGGFSIPPDSGMKTSLARLIAALFASLDGAEAIIYISEWGVWPSSENLEIFDSYRQSKGEKRGLEQAPVHRFDSASEDSFVGILCFVLYFFWDAEIFDLEGKCLVSISHDERFDIRSNDPAVRQFCAEAMECGQLMK
jgi:hypothetical protein